MLFFLTLIFCCQLAGELLVAAAGLAVPGPVIGMLLLFVGLLVHGSVPENLASVGDSLLTHLSLLFIPAGVGILFGLAVRSLGRPLFFLMCLLMIPVATAELGTDGWIKGLMTPVLLGYEINPAMALVFSAAIMLVLRVFAGGVLRFFSPPGLSVFR